MVFLVLRYNGHFLLYAMVIDASAKDRMDCTTSLETEGILTYQMQPDSNKTKNYVLHPCPLTRNTRKTGNWLAGFSLLSVLYDQENSNEYLICVVHGNPNSSSTLEIINLKLLCFPAFLWNCTDRNKWVTFSNLEENFIKIPVLRSQSCKNILYSVLSKVLHIRTGLKEFSFLVLGWLPSNTEHGRERNPTKHHL